MFSTKMTLSNFSKSPKIIQITVFYLNLKNDILSSVTFLVKSATNCIFMSNFCYILMAST